jgi:hypothetical protein
MKLWSILCGSLLLLEKQYEAEDQSNSFQIVYLEP